MTNVEVLRKKYDDMCRNLSVEDVRAIEGIGPLPNSVLLMGARDLYYQLLQAKAEAESIGVFYSDGGGIIHHPV